MQRQASEDFLELATALSGPLYRTATLLTADRHLAEDLVQETLGKMFASWRRVSKVDNPRGYARTVLVNTYISHRRLRGSSELATERLPERSHEGPDPTLRLTLLDAMRHLSPKDRAVLVLRYWEDQSVEQCALALGLSSGAVRNRSMRALGQLRAALGDDLHELAG